MRTKLFIATPMYGGMCHGSYTKSMASLFSASTKANLPLHLEIPGNESLIQRARNTCVHAFLESDFSHFLFVDADIGFEPQDVFSMLSFLLNDKNGLYDVLACAYPKKGINWERVQTAKARKAKDLVKIGNDFAFNPLENTTIQFKGRELTEVADAGTGFMMIPRKTFEKFQKYYPEQLYSSYKSFGAKKEKDQCAFFDTKIDPDTGLYLAEDYMFCKWVRKMGGRIWILPWVSLSHTGNYTHFGSLTETSALFSV